MQHKPTGAIAAVPLILGIHHAHPFTQLREALARSPTLQLHLCPGLLTQLSLLKPKRYPDLEQPPSSRSALPDVPICRCISILT